MKEKLKKSAGIKITLSYFGNVSNRFGLAQKHSTFIEDKSAIQLHPSSINSRIPVSLDKEINKHKKNRFNFRPINIKDFDSTNNINFFNYVKNYPNLDRINTSKRITSFKRPNTSRHLFLRNEKETSAIVSNLNSPKDCNPIIYFTNLKIKKLKEKRKFTKIEKKLNFSEEKSTKYSRFLIDDFLRFKRKNKNNINENINYMYKEIKKKNINIFNNKILKLKINYFFPPDKFGSIKFKEVINENDLNIQDNNLKKQYFNNVNRKLFNGKFSIINGKNSKRCDASTNTEIMSFSAKKD